MPMQSRTIRVVAFSRTLPDDVLPGMPAAGLGFGDACDIYVDGELVWRGPFRVCPNAYHPTSGEPWHRVYGFLAPGRYPFVFIYHPTLGPSLLLNEGKRVASRTPNPNHGGKRYLEEVLVHTGGTGKNSDWPGSAGCPTVPKNHAEAFFSEFRPGDAGTFVVVDEMPNETKEPYHTLTHRQGGEVMEKIAKLFAAFRARGYKRHIGGLLAIAFVWIRLFGLDVPAGIEQALCYGATSLLGAGWLDRALTGAHKG